MIDSILLASKASLLNSTLFARWKRDNPGEFARVETYWERGDVFPQVASPFGLHYALDAHAYVEATAEMPFAPI